MSPPGERATQNATLDDDVIPDILVRLPSASVLRCRAVCKAWRSITTDPSFLAAHAHRRATELLVVSGERRSPRQKLLDTIPLSLHVDDGDDMTRRRRELEHPEHCDVGSLVGSCDGLLLFEKAPRGECHSDFFVCNPVTRQGTRLDLTPPACRGNLVLLCGFYRHGPSGEHRLLVLANERERHNLNPDHHWPHRRRSVCIVESSAAHYVFSAASAASVSSRAPRRLGPVTGKGNVVVQHYNQVPNNNCVHYRGKLHWTTHPATSAGKILAFDTVSEAFRLISYPRWSSDQYYRLVDDLCLLELNGRLAMTESQFSSGSMELWVLEDYDFERSWSHRFRIDLPPLFDARCWAMGTGVRDEILVGSYNCSSAALYHFRRRAVPSLVKQIKIDNCRLGTGRPFVFKDSIVPYDFFDPY